MDQDKLIKFYIQYHRYDKLFENEETFRASYKSVRSTPMLSIYDDVVDADIENNNWISYRYSICQNAYLKSSIIKIYSVTDKNIVWYKLNELPLN